jgi:DNA-binding MurR/RpiR family transcriptional regulator
MGDPTDASQLAVSQQIRQRLPDLSPAERRVARALLSGPPTIGLESSASLARYVGVSGPTVSRFATRLGYDDYGGFQEALHADIAARIMPPTDVYHQHRSDDAANDGDLLHLSGSVLAEAVSTSVQGQARADFRKAAQLLADTGHTVWSSGGWFSHLAASYLAVTMREIRPRVQTVPALPAERTAAINDTKKGDIAAIFDFRRYERPTYEFAKAFHDAGARIVLFTDPWLSPITDIAAAVLPAQVTGQSPFESLTPTFAVVETIITAVADTLGPQAAQRFERFGTITEDWIQHLAHDDRGVPFDSLQAPKGS